MSRTSRAKKAASDSPVGAMANVEGKYRFTEVEEGPAADDECRDEGKSEI
jgi:UDP-N-acetylglucosamine pyrophosphorylase